MPELAEAGVRRISVGGAFSYVAAGAVAAAGRELLEDGTHELHAAGRRRRAGRPPGLPLSGVSPRRTRSASTVGPLLVARRVLAPGRGVEHHRRAGGGSWRGHGSAGVDGSPVRAKASQASIIRSASASASGPGAGEGGQLAPALVAEHERDLEAVARAEPAAAWPGTPSRTGTRRSGRGRPAASASRRPGTRNVRSDSMA